MLLEENNLTQRGDTMKIGINCGHTVSKQPGCGAVGLIDESVETRTIGKALITKLRAMGHTVVDCTNDYALSTNDNLSKICEMANAQKLDMFISIHFNAGKGKGTEVYTYGGTKHAEALNICENMSKLGFVNRGVKDGSKLYVIRKTETKAMLVEVCFVDTQSDVDLYKTNISNIVNAIAEGITGEKVGKENNKMGVFKDVPETDYAYKHIKKLKDYGIVNGYSDGTFCPDDTITRREMAIIIANALTVCGK